MILLQIDSLRKHYGPLAVLDGVSLEVRSGDRIALVGPNGTGKTTLMKILAGEEEADAGSVNLHASATMAYLEQQPNFPEGLTVWDAACEGMAELLQLNHKAEQLASQMAEVASDRQREQLGSQYDQLQHELQRRGGYHVDHKIQAVLDGLGFAGDQLNQPVKTLSGGQQNRLLLARLLLREADVLLLDEPSNHLDIQATTWLEDYLAGCSQAMVLVSHDRYLLDKVATRTVELLHGTADTYTGNFTAYRKQKTERLAVQRSTFEKQQEEIEKLKDFIRRHHHGQKHAQAEDRQKKLDRIKPVPPPREISAPTMGFPPASRTGDIVLRVEHLSKAFDHPLFENLSFTIERGEKWGILGPNGCGKTTLLRCLLNIVEPDHGAVHFGANVRHAYFDQLLSFPDLDQEVVEAVRPEHKEFTEPQRRDLLARFGVTGDMVFQRLSSLSGGERNRAALARMSATDSNLLVLDEPTNHLDLWARASLEESLLKFDGTVIFVSHDRYFINQVADHLLVVEPGRFRVIEGNYDLYLHLVKEGLAAGEATSGQAAGERDSQPNSPAQPKRAKPERRKRKYPYRKVAEIETEISEREARVEELHTLLGSPEVLRDGEQVKALSAELDEVKAMLVTLYEHWEEAAEMN